MPSVKVSIEHKLDKDDAKEKIKSLLINLKEQFKDKISNVTESWDEYRSDFSFKVMGIPIKGNLFVENTLVKLDGKIPFAAVPFKKMIETTIKNEAEKLLK